MKKLIFLAVLGFIAGCKSDGNKKDEEEKITISNSRDATAQNPELKESISRGAEIYNNFCASCHLASGEGIPNVFPPINGSDWLTEKRTETIRAVKHGLQGPITVNGVKYNNLMPDLGLSDREVADVINYTFKAWDNDVEPPVTVEEVEEVEK